MDAMNEEARAAERSGLVATAYKVALVVGGFVLLASVAQSMQPVEALLASATACYFAAGFAAGLGAPARRAVAAVAVPGTFALIVLLNVTGWIGTLTGSVQSSEKFAFFLAAPFYLLAIAAYFTDVVAGKREQAAFLDYLAYVALPFKLLAGPLEQPGLLRQIEQIRPRVRTARLLAAWPWVVLGAFMKFVIANRLSPGVNLPAADPVSALLTAAVFELKFYFDFAGYSFIAYGLALAAGLKITRNFEHPFFAANVVVFWRRWHMSLGRFLGRYVLEPNLKFLRSRRSKELFAAGIFLVSAMWHGGTFNYLLWGLFHAACYYFYIRFLKHKDVPGLLGVASMVAFFVLGRLLATDADSARLLGKLANLLNPLAYTAPVGYESDKSELLAIALAAVFLALEAISLRIYGRARPYHLFRKPLAALVALCSLLLLASPSGALLYARI